METDRLPAAPGPHSLASLIGDDACLARHGRNGSLFAAVLWRLPAATATSFPAMADHMIAVHLDGAGPVERVVDGRSVRTARSAGTVTIDPAGRASAWYIGTSSEALHFYLDPHRLQHLAGELLDRDPGAIQVDDPFGVEDRIIEGLAQASVAELRRPATASRLFLDALEQALGLHVLRCYSSMGRERDLREATARDRGRLPRRRLRVVLDHVEQHLADPISVDDLARVAGMSPYHFSRTFKATVGESPHRFVMAQRVRRAEMLLTETDVTLAEIALRTGFSSQSHMNAAFRRLRAITPSRLRANGARSCKGTARR